ncbi:TPA: transposase [Klebsiella variicola]|nr:transposase [Klebsiella variicola]
MPRQGHVAGCAGEKELTLARLREWVRDLQARYGACERPVCFALRISRSSFRYRSGAADDCALGLRIREIEAWRIHYNQRRPHSAPGWMTPSEFAEKSAGWQNMQPT